MIAMDEAVFAALAPVRAALTTAARTDAERLDAQAEAAAEQVVAVAREQAARILAEARQRGKAEAAAVAAVERAGARRRGRAIVLRARREAYEELVVNARTAVARLCDRPGYAGIRDQLTAMARDTLGADARVREADGGGVVAEAPGRRLDLSLARFAERAAAAAAAEDLLIGEPQRADQEPDPIGPRAAPKPGEVPA